MKVLFILFSLLLSVQLLAQEPNRNFDIRFGAGLSLLGTGDMRGTMFENEINYKVNQYIATALSVGYGKSNDGVYETASFIQGNINAYISPFKNSRKK